MAYRYQLMALYFFVIDGDVYHRDLAPALAASWRQRSFLPCRALCQRAEGKAQSFRDKYHLADASLPAAVAEGMPFDRHVWRCLVGQLLVFLAADIPELQTAPGTLCWLENKSPPGVPHSRSQFSAIDQVHFGSRDLIFGGGYYRPEHAGLNDLADVCRLAGFLENFDSSRWTPTDLEGCLDLADEESRQEELAFVKDWFPALKDLYHSAGNKKQLIICEMVGTD